MNTIGRNKIPHNPGPKGNDASAAKDLNSGSCPDQRAKPSLLFLLLLLTHITYKT